MLCYYRSVLERMLEILFILAFTTCDVDNGLYLCADQSCMSTPDQCEGLERTCPESLPTLCSDGMCVDNALQCRSAETYCPSNRPFKCSSGKCCESDNEACCGKTLSSSDCSGTLELALTSDVGGD